MPDYYGPCEVDDDCLDTEWGYSRCIVSYEGTFCEPLVLCHWSPDDMGTGCPPAVDGKAAYCENPSNEDVPELTYCTLYCEDPPDEPDEYCPPGMICEFSYVCVWPPGGGSSTGTSG
jgi:hypothetical protein